jgi:hypothetical protein
LILFLILFLIFGFPSFFIYEKKNVCDIYNKEMVGMQTQFGRGRYVDAISNRTIQSGGSVGGNKKAGIVVSGPSWPQGNFGSHFLYRAPQRTPSLATMLLKTTRYPVQYRRNGYYASHTGSLG